MAKSAAALAASAVIVTATFTAAASAVAEQTSRSNSLVEQNGIWSAADGYIETYNMNTYSESFLLKNSTITIGVSETYGGRQISRLEAKPEYELNYKWTLVRVEGNKGHSAESTPQILRNGKNAWAIAYDVGTVTSGEYYSFLYNGSGSGADYLERSAVKVKKSQ